MSDKRAYRSTAREESAGRTRRRIVEAAAELFVERGYAGTTIDAVAEKAEVSRRTVFTSARRASAASPGVVAARRALAAAVPAHCRP